MVAAFTITEINYLVVSLLWDLVRPLSYIYLQCYFFDCLLCFRHSDKSGYAFSNVFHRIAVGAQHKKLFSTEMFPLNLVLQIVKFMVLF